MSIFQENIQLYSLQKKPEEDQLLGLLKMYKVIELGKIFKNFSNTSRAITKLCYSRGRISSVFKASSKGFFKVLCEVLTTSCKFVEKIVKNE